jgi:hypothetical protein
MKTRSVVYSQFEITTLNPTNLIAIESSGGNVLVRAAKNNFSGRRKAFLIRQLAAEGYIPDRFQTFTEDEPVAGLTWVLDRSLLEVGREATLRTGKFMRRMIAGGCVALVLEMLVVWLRAQ